MKVVDLSTDVAGGFATKLLAMSGIRVVRPLTPDLATGVPACSDVLRLYLDAGKEEIQAPVGDPLSSLAADDDVVFTTFDRGSRSAPGEYFPDTCVLVTTSSFGASGPYAAWRGGPLADWAAGGYLAITGDPGRPPLIGPEHLCGYVGGYTAAIAAEAALRQRQQTGLGQHIDISTMESMLSVHQSTFSRLAVGILRERTGRYTEVYPLVVRPCRDGYVSLGIVTDAEFDRLAIAIGREDLVTDERFLDAGSRWIHRDDLDVELDGFLGNHDADQIVEMLTAAGIAVAKVVGPLEVTTNPQLVNRRFWDVGRGSDHSARMPGNPIPAAKRRSAGGRPARPRIPGVRARRAEGLPLRDVTVLDFTAFWAGPSATRWLADLGAKVIWIERPGSRIERDWSTADVTSRVMHVFHLKMNRNKQSMILDLADEAGREIARRLTEDVDVLVENFRPGVMTSLGLGPGDLCQANPGLVYVSLSGFGSSGPWATRRSYGPTIEAASSIEGRTGYLNGEPLRLGHTLPDGAGGLAGALVALRGLRERGEHGAGGWFDISQLEVYSAMSGEDIITASTTGAELPRIGNRSRYGAVQGVFPCAGDDEWIAIRLATSSDIEQLSALTSIPNLREAATPPRDDELLESLISSYTKPHNKRELAACLQAQGLEAFPVLKPGELVADDHLRQRGFFASVPFDGHDLTLPGSPLHSTPRLVDPQGPAPRFGEHTTAILDAFRIDRND
ncbi:MAG: CoA transferase [Acidimicrobiaceae bacterium]|nr:CoA transferase [Acidimicrobiaceae bacterium]